MLYTESMHYFFTVFFFLFGSLLGSFSNVVVLRMAISRSVIFPPSACPKCDHQLFAKDLVPVFSWLFLRGKCRYCKAPISIQYPLVESFMAIIVGLAFYKTAASLDFICLASSMAIWFIISTIFFRGEVLKHQPFLWAVIYSIGLRFLLAGSGMFNQDFGIMLTLAVLVGVIAYFRNNAVEFTRWFALAFLTFLNMPVSAFWYLAGGLVVLAIANDFPKSSKHAKSILFGIQLICIITALLMTAFQVTFVQMM